MSNTNICDGTLLKTMNFRHHKTDIEKNGAIKYIYVPCMYFY